MRIALIIERMDPSRGGRELSTAQIAEALAERGHEVTILCQSGSPPVEAVGVRAVGRRGITRSGRLQGFVTDVQRAIAQGRYDIVHATLPIPGANVYQLRGGTVPGHVAASARRWGRLAVARKAMTCVNLCRRRMARLESQVVADPDVLCLPVSRMVADELRTHYGRTQRTRVLYSGVDVPDVSAKQRADWRQRVRYKLNVGPDDPVFITVAKNFGLKGISDAIVTFARFFHACNGRVNARLLVVGRQDPETYERHASLRDVGRQVVFVGPTENIFELYSAADACVLLSWYDACSRVVLEAVRWSLPTITTTCNGGAEVLADGAGIVVQSPKDYPAIVAAFDELASPANRQARAAACRAAGGKLTIERHVDELLAAYGEAARLK